MQVGSVLDAQVGFAIFDAWLACVKGHQKQGGVESPLIDAAFKAFDAYAATVEASNEAEIAGVGAMLGYQVNSQGTGAISTSQMAPFLALNVMA